MHPVPQQQHLMDPQLHVEGEVFQRHVLRRLGRHKDIVVELFTDALWCGRE